MNDIAIINLFFERDEDAITECERKYGAYLYRVAYNVLTDRADSEECVNDTYLSAWNAIPPERPSILQAYLSKIARRLSIDRLRRRTRQKRQPSEYLLSLDELSECIAGSSSVEAEVELSILGNSIERYLENLPKDSRCLFVGRYFYCDSIKEVARYCKCSEAAAKSKLFRLRAGLREHLLKEGFDI